ncbi:hypothetical protein BPOR_1028g00010 [Botrytis porri]|uniref:Uncharacterized protein n=1 Tax=Botrytis porri TaxID=87229 RepID=A0A4Z1K6M7_9HELO|nr:hypothetical protein BPOR_1028g00010 [Botrytis porri]
MMCANEPLHDAALIYQDICVADTAKNVTFTASSLGVLAISSGLLVFPPASAVVTLASFTGLCASLVSTGVFAQNTVVNGIALRRSRNHPCSTKIKHSTGPVSSTWISVRGY